MMRSLWTAASGMKTQQLSIDTISNNLANVRTVGFKKDRLEFKSLLYETMRRGTNRQGGGQPINLQVGHGVRAAGSAKAFTQGSLERTENPLDVAINGNGFFAVRMPDGGIKYTKDGSFKLSVEEDGLVLTDTNGYPVLSTEDERIVLPADIQISKVVIDPEGKFSVTTEEGAVDLGIQLSLFQFTNNLGLSASGDSLFEQTLASGLAIKEIDDDTIKKSSLDQGVLEMSNVQVVEEMVAMIVTQRAYELNSKAIQTSDEMLGLANQLKR